MMHLSFPWYEFVFRALSVYLFLLIFIRMLGKKQTAQMTPFDFVLLLIISNAVQNSMNGGDVSLLGGLISAATLLGLNLFFGWVVYRSKRMEDLIEGKPEFIILNGKLNQSVLKSELLTLTDVESAIREQGCEKIEQVEWAVFENSGKITVKKRES